MGKQDQYNFGGTDDELPATPESDDSTSSSDSQTSSGEGSESQASHQQQDEVGDIDVSRLPLKLRRDNVTDFRENKTLKLLPETQKAMEDDVLRFLSDEFADETMHKTDAFEIIVWNGLYDDDGTLDVEGLKQQARKMGYGLTE